MSVPFKCALDGASAQPALVDEEDDAAFCAGFLLMACHTLRFQLRVSVWLCSPCPASRPLRTPTQRSDQFPHVAGMIANAKLALDQVGHTRATPERGLIIQFFGAFQRGRTQPFAVLLIQSRLASRATDSSDR